MFGSAIKHEHELVLGFYSVHTNEKSLQIGEERIKEIGQELKMLGKIEICFINQPIPSQCYIL